MSMHPRPRSSRKLIAALMAIPILFLAACAGPAEPDDGASSPKKTELVIALSAAPPSLDPAQINQALQWFVDLAYAPLIQRSSDGSYRPSLATEWGYVGEGNSVFELKLREGVTFSDGGKLDAAAVVKHLEYVKSLPGTQWSPYMASFEKIEATDDMTVQITSVVPNPEFEMLFSQAGVGIADIISPKALEAPEALGTSTAGAGPYVLDVDSTVTGDTYVYLPNKSYWDPKNVSWEKVTIKVIANDNSILNAMKSGQVDIGPGSFTTAPEAEKAGLLTHFLPNVFAGLNIVDRGGEMVQALADQRVRQAINHAIDRDAISAAIYGKYGTPTTQITREAGFTEQLDARYPYDLDKAKALLKEAGYADGFSFPAVSTPFFSGDLIMQAIASQLAEVGIDMTIESKTDPVDYFQDMVGKKYPVAVIGYGSQPLFIAGPGLFLPGAPFNPFNSTDEQVMELYGALAAADGDEVEDVAVALQTRLVDLAWWAPAVWAPLGYYATSAIDPKAITSTIGESPIPAIIDVKPAS